MKDAAMDSLSQELEIGFIHPEEGSGMKQQDVYYGNRGRRC